MSELKDLIARVEALSGADREVEIILGKMFPTDQIHSNGTWFEADDDIRFPLVTASIDAALAFAERVLPEGTNIMLKLRTKGKYYHAEFEDIEFESGEVEDVTAYNQPTLPLAIILATLKAKVSE